MTEGARTKLTLRYTIDGDAFEVVATRGGAEIGRAAECRLVIEDSEVSRHHARLSHDDAKWTITDLGSTNGTAVNGEELRQPAQLSDGDKVTIHTYELTVSIEEDAADVLQLLEMGASEAVSAADVTKAADETSAEPAAAPGGLSVSSRSTLGANHVLELFSSAAEALLGAVGVEGVLEEIMRLAFENVPAQRGAITLCEEEGAELRPVVVRGLAGDDELRISRKIATGAVEEHKAFLIREVESDDRFTASDTIARMDIRSAVCVPMEHDGQVQGLIYLDTRDNASRFGERDLRLVTVLGMLGAIGIRQTRYREEIAHQLQIRSRLERYSSPSVVERLQSVGEYGEMLAEEREISVLFTDLCGFTALSEKMAPADTARLLNSIFEQLTQVVFTHEGTLDKFMGDGMMAFFGAPFDQPDHAQRAVAAAWGMSEALDAINSELTEDRRIDMRIGVNTGPAIVGDIGSQKRRDYTVVGDTVNVASRLESTVATPGQIAISHQTHELVEKLFRCEPLPVPEGRYLPPREPAGRYKRQRRPGHRRIGRLRMQRALACATVGGARVIVTASPSYAQLRYSRYRKDRWSQPGAGSRSRQRGAAVERAEPRPLPGGRIRRSPWRHRVSSWPRRSGRAPR